MLIQKIFLYVFIQYINVYSKGLRGPPSRRLIFSKGAVVVVTMPRSKGKANYKVNVLILVVEEMLPNRARGRRLQRSTSQEMERWCFKIKMTSRGTGSTSAETSSRNPLATQVIPRGT
jgi:hypothetical protein